jgi:hypothetical protein
VNRESYNFAKYEEGAYAYAFTSVGKQGTITKVVYFQEIGTSLYNLAMGDATGDADKPLDDMKVSDNGDMPKVIATVAKILVRFLEQNSAITVLIEGNTPIKKALYQRIIANNIQDLTPLFVIYGVDEEGNITLFNSEIQYHAFVVKLKKLL